METVRVLNVLGEEKPREVVAASLPSAQFSTDDYWLMRAKHPGYDRNREEARYLSALLGCNVLVVGDFGTRLRNNPVTSNRPGMGLGMGRDRVFKVAWGSTAP